MSLDVYFREDVRQGIVAVIAAMLSASAAHGWGNWEYCRGVLDASRAQALNYGLSWPDILQSVRAELGRDADEPLALLAERGAL